MLKIKFFLFLPVRRKFQHRRIRSVKVYKKREEVFLRLPLATFQKNFNSLFQSLISQKLPELQLDQQDC